jgi:hypothetical protein
MGSRHTLVLESSQGWMSIHCCSCGGGDGEVAIVFVLSAKPWNGWWVSEHCMEPNFIPVNHDHDCHHSFVDKDN